MISQFVKLVAIMCIISTLFSCQADSAALSQSEVLLQRVRRMTPFWRWIAQRPLGASCRGNNECGSKYCWKNRCSSTVHKD
ncbi:liver-expressed antimicrobial peptide 2 [Callorhinchus milii]|uniref:Liver-expressed antimicrobial peptide 2 n=1 Tax=Callorhinchus milii TaxID=7868 RepID=K4G4B8_CALMI|nr:liver-expressed antimicrobial peptide 2 [Callorhinchus milii]AFK10894.1 liver-expressed antimicrobial peptide 2 precursor [Callorhinchus milii]AFM86251.1 liver-expressed antimicrobial peptide 2 precursor [Callorhinchus milii]